MQTHVFSDLTLSQPLSSVARLCYYADTQLHDHIGESFISCLFKYVYLIVLIIMSIIQRVSMEMMTGCSVTGKSCTVIQLIPVSVSRKQ